MKVKTPINAVAAERIKKVMARNGLNGITFSKAIGVSQQSVSKMSTGKTPVTLATAKKIHEVFPEYPISWLIGEEEVEIDAEVTSLIVEEVIHAICARLLNYTEEHE